jgi:hypothetical protein
MGVRSEGRRSRAYFGVPNKGGDVMRRLFLAAASAVCLAAGMMLAAASAGAAVPLWTAVNNYIHARPGQITAAVTDLNTGRTWVWHQGMLIREASIVKVDILAALMWRTTSLTAYQRQLATQMIEVSDNNAATALYRTIGREAGLAAFGRAAGLTSTWPNAAWGLSTTTATDQLTLLKRLAYHNSLLTDAERAYELDLMAHVVSWQRWGIIAGVPRGVAISIKDGWLPYGGAWRVNSIGYVRGLGRKYVVAVLTYSPTFDSGRISIEGISRLIWPNMSIR